MGGFNRSQSTAEPWKEQIPYLEKGFQRAENVYGPEGSFMQPEYYPDRTLAGFDPYQTMGQESIVNYATGRRPAAMQSHAENALLRQLGGRVPMGAGTPWNAASYQYGNLAASEEQVPFSSFEPSPVLEDMDEEEQSLLRQALGGGR